MYNRALGQTEISNIMLNASGPTWLTPLPANAAVPIAAGAKLNLNGASATVSSLTGLGTVDNSIGTPTLAVNATSNIQFDGLITNTSGTVSLTKYGNAALTLSGTNTYNGPTVVGAGTLNITGSLQPVARWRCLHDGGKRCGEFFRHHCY